LIVLAVQGGIGINSLSRLSATGTEVISRVGALAQNVHGIQSQSQTAAGSVRELSAGVRAGLITQMRDGTGDLKVLERSVNTVVQSMQSNVDRLEKELKRKDLDKAAATVLEDALIDAQDNLDKSKKGCLPVIRSAVAKLTASMVEADRTATSIGAIEQTMAGFAATAEAAAAQGDDAVKISEKSRSEASAAGVKIFWALGLGVAIGIVVPIFITRRITRPIGALVKQVRAIAGSDLTGRELPATGNDEISELARATNGMLVSLRTLVTQVQSGIVQIDAGGTQIASASQTLAQGASEQASSLQQISASIEQMSGQTQQSADNASQANTLSQESKNAADRGQKEMAEMSRAVTEIMQSSTEISKIIKVIDEIAFQTNLLALNAAVEAARAGEAGKGFAVVAEEVRNLARRSAEAAKNTSSMIEESVRRSHNGVQIAGRVSRALEEIATGTRKVNTLLSEIASAAGEQATGIGQVNQGVSQLDQVTQQNAGNSEEMASSAEELSSQVASLNELVAQFKVNGGGQTVPDKAVLPARAAHATAKAKATPQRANMAVKSVKPDGSNPRGAADTHATNDPEKIIPMENDEVLASF
jgi:methyl-accepting chemotaxis protein